MPFIQYQDLNISQARLDKIATANEIIATYQQQGYTLTLRQLYYQHVARGLIPNNEREYKNLGSVISDGRVAGLIDWNSIEDRGRGVRPVYVQEDERECLNGLEYHLSLDFWHDQDAYVEVWVEKEALAAVIERPASRWHVPYMACKGYLSQSEAWRAGRRFEQASAMGVSRLAIIHLGDHDPSGIDMTRDNQDRVDLFSEQAGVEVHRIALNYDQVQQYNPPPNPAKMSDSRASDYVSRFGFTSWELDALEPRVLDKLIADKVQEFIDPDLWQATQERQDEQRQVLSRLHENWDEVRAFVEGLE